MEKSFKLCQSMLSPFYLKGFFLPGVKAIFLFLISGIVKTSVSLCNLRKHAVSQTCFSVWFSQLCPINQCQQNIEMSNGKQMRAYRLADETTCVRRLPHAFNSSAYLERQFLGAALSLYWWNAAHHQLWHLMDCQDLYIKCDEIVDKWDQRLILMLRDSSIPHMNDKYAIAVLSRPLILDYIKKS